MLHQLNIMFCSLLCPVAPDRHSGFEIRMSTYELK
jgi:hypothetical protein